MTRGCSEDLERLSTHFGKSTVQITCNVFVFIRPISTAILALIPLPEHTSQQPSIQNNMSQTPTATTSSSNYQSIFDNAIEAYKKKTKKDLRSHPLLDKLQNCNSPDAVLSILYEQIPGFDQSRATDDKLTRWLNPTVNVLCTFSGVIGGGISLASPTELRVKVLIFDRHTGISTIGSDLHWNRCPSLSECLFIRSIQRLITTPNSPRRQRPFLMARTHSLQSSSA